MSRKDDDQKFYDLFQTYPEEAIKKYIYGSQSIEKLSDFEVNYIAKKLYRYMNELKSTEIHDRCWDELQNLIFQTINQKFIKANQYQKQLCSIRILDMDFQFKNFETTAIEDQRIFLSKVVFGTFIKLLELEKGIHLPEIDKTKYESSVNFSFYQISLK